MELENFLHEKMRSFGAATYKKFLGTELIHHWRELVDKNISDKIKPVKIERDVLYVAVESSAFRDQLKFLEEEIIDAINEKFSQDEPLVKEIRIAYGVQIADDKTSLPAQIEEPKNSPEDMILSDEEIKSCEERANKISNEELRKTILHTLLSQAKYQKFRLANGWHKCAKCESLCAAEETLCEVCKIKEREAMINALFKIFYDAPHLKAWDAQKILLEKMPYMKKECALDVIESARTSLIQKVAGKIRFGDEESPEVLKLVALEKRLPLDKLNPAIIRRTLIDLQFNLSEQPKLQRYLTKTRK
ncbi:MAG: DUF721 domain-containing protein [Selenomonadaceae bacterium]|nr:DUF721 domain-containing protein [Selenomonadaceae bacterium]